MNKKIKMKLLGLLLVLFGLAIITYSLFSSSSTSFWGIYTGLLMLISGLGFLGINVGSYPF